VSPFLCRRIVKTLLGKEKAGGGEEYVPNSLVVLASLYDNSTHKTWLLGLKGTTYHALFLASFSMAMAVYPSSIFEVALSWFSLGNDNTYVLYSNSTATYATAASQVLAHLLHLTRSASEVYPPDLRRGPHLQQHPVVRILVFAPLLPSRNRHEDVVGQSAFNCDHQPKQRDGLGSPSPMHKDTRQSHWRHMTGQPHSTSMGSTR